MTAAVIDLGTNTFHLIIAEVVDSSVHVLYKTNVPVKLGEGRINEHIIIPAAFERGIQTLKTFQKTIKAYGATTVKAIATSAVRSASNGTDFVVITGDQEAIYIFNGVKATGVISGLSLIMDIGGGSTEFIICDNEQLLWKKSYDIGAARLLQAYFNTDPISQSDQQAITDHLDKELIELKEACSLYQPKHLIGSAGAFETFAAMLIKDLEIKSIKSAPIDLTAYHELAQKLITSNHDERDAMPDLIKLRVDMIVIASILTNYVIDNLKIAELSLSTYDLKMGVLHTLTRSKP